MELNLGFATLNYILIKFHMTLPDITYSGIAKTSLTSYFYYQNSLKLTVPCGLVARIRRSHRRGRGPIPRTGEYHFR